MSLQKNKKGVRFVSCEKCQAIIPSKDIENHEGFCPPNLETFHHSFILNQVLYGTLCLKSDEEIKSMSTRQKDGLVFLSTDAMELCSLNIGDNATVYTLHEKGPPIVLKVWPTNEKSLTSVLVTKNGLENSNFTQNDIVTVKKFDDSTSLKACQISLVILTGLRSLQITSELNNRLRKSYEGCYLTRGNVIYIAFYGSVLKFEVKVVDHRIDEYNINNCLEKLSIGETRMFYLADGNTKWKIYESQESFIQATTQPQKHQVAGIDTELREIREMMQFTFKKPKAASSRFIKNKSVLLYGSSGTGKTTTAKMLAEELKINMVELYPSNLYSKGMENPEDGIEDAFREAVENSPSILLLDEIDMLCPTRNGRISEAEKRISATVSTCIDEVCEDSHSKVFIIATSNKIDSIDPALRRCGRLDWEIEIPTPTPHTRQLILQKLLLDVPQKLSDADYREIAFKTHGFVGADLVSLCSRANLICQRRTEDKVELQDFREALKKVKPSAMREVQIEVPNVKWLDIGGQENLKLILKQTVEWPLKHADSFLRLGMTPPKGVLMFGPPGCSKTMIAKALATESGLNFLSIKGPELFSKWVGESERAIREVFRKARQVAPSIVFFDEIDALGGERSSGSSTSVQERVLAQLLTELDGVTPLGDVTILAATNRPDKIDKALLRPGRLDRIVYVPLPDDNTRRDILRIKFLKMPVKGVSIDELVTKTEGYSGAEVNAVCEQAAMKALEEDLQCECVETRHFEKALKLVTPRTPESLIKIYQDYI